MSDAASETKFLEALLKLADKAAGKREGAKGSSLPVYLFLTALVMAGFAFMGWLAVRAKRKAARLEYELRLKEEAHRRESEKVVFDQNEETRAAAETAISHLVAEAGELKKELLALEEESVRRAKALAEATSWDTLVIVDRRK